MKIAFDIRGVSDHPAGKGIWTKNVMETMMKAHPEHEYFFLTDKKEPSISKHYPLAQFILVEGGGLRWHWSAYQALLTQKIDFFLASESYLIPYFHSPKKLKIGLVVHDLVVFKSPAKHQKKATWIERLTLKKAAQKSQWIFTVSENTKKDLREQYPNLNLETKTHVVYAGIRPQFLQPVDLHTAKKTLEKFALPSHFLLMASTLEPRKNILGTIRAYAKLPDVLRQSYPLAIAGKKGWYFEQIFEEVKHLGLQKHVHFLGYVSDKELVHLMHLTTLFLFPSFYEGFGLPVLEAMAVGAPVLTSNNSSLPEVGGEAAVYVDPYDVEAMAKSMESLLVNEPGRQKLIQSGATQLSRFSWEKAVKEMMRWLGASPSPSERGGQN